MWHTCTSPVEDLALSINLWGPNVYYILPNKEHTIQCIVALSTDIGTMFGIEFYTVEAFSLIF